MSEDLELPVVVSSGEIKLGAMKVTVHTLSNGQRVIDADDMPALNRLFEGLADEAKREDSA